MVGVCGGGRHKQAQYSQASSMKAFIQFSVGIPYFQTLKYHQILKFFPSGRYSAAFCTLFVLTDTNLPPSKGVLFIKIL